MRLILRWGLFANAKLGEDHTQQIIGGEFTSDAVERILAKPQLFGQQVQRRDGGLQTRVGVLQMRVHLPQGMNMSLSRHEQAFCTAALPAHDVQQLLT